MRIKRYILLLLLNVCALSGTGVGIGVRAYAQTDTIRYVRTKEYGGAYNNDGRSWETAKDRVQDAINDLRDYLAQNHLSSGSVYIAAGNYVPTESTESSGGSMLNTSFKIYSGIHVYGGFNPEAPESRPGLRKMINGKTCEENWADPSGVGTTSATDIACQWDLRHKTILTGNHSSSVVSFTFDSIRGRYNMTYPASSFHVVWFATNGMFEGAGINDSIAGHYRPLEDPASLDGCVISSGNASSRNTLNREHTAYGGGVYMVGNSSLKNCIVERCNATLGGGGIYADGGGTIEFCFVHTCQSPGVGVYLGYGGGVFIDQDGSIGHSHITSCAARCGGGLFIGHISEEYPWAKRIAAHILASDTEEASHYSPFATACVINNNTANAEGGGIYLAEGGTINHCTVTANNCIGPDVTYYGRRHGRTGGIYIRDCGMLFNSVFWGNRCDANNDIQFASVRQKSGKTGYDTYVYHSGFMNHDITDWTGASKEKVFALDRRNWPTKGSTGNYCCFFNPTVDPTDWSNVDASKGLHGAGVFMHLARLTDIPGPRIWHLTSYSALDQKGVQWNQSMQDASEWLIHSHTDYGVVSNPYEPLSTLGALVRRTDPITYALVPPQGQEGRLGGAPIPTLFIDPNRKGTYDESGQFVEPSREGNSWDAPIKEFGEALEFFRRYLQDDEGESHHYEIPDLDEDGMATGDPVEYPYIQILVKEGTLTTCGPGNYLDRNIRSAAIRVESHMRLYGGYPSTLTGTNTAGRNPRTYKSIITANITGIEGERGYNNNSAHVIVMSNVEHTIVDGFTLSDANTHNVYLSQSAHAGGGVLINNATKPAEKRINMVGNQLRNCVINNCTSPKGAAIYVNGEHPKTNGDICYAELITQNCIIRNNKADYVIHDADVEDHGVITANGRAYVHIEHCTVVNNVGFPFKADSKQTDSEEPIQCSHEDHQYQSPYHGYIRVDNSLIYGNGDRTLDNLQQFDAGIGHVTSVNEDGQDYVFGKWNMFDADLTLHEADVHQPRGFFADGFTVSIIEHFLPEGVVSHFTDDIADVPADSAGRANQCIFSRDITNPNYPAFVNPARNVGNTPDGEKPLYGGVVTYAPLTTNPCVNAAHPDDYTEHDNYDRSDVLLRDRGGAPDVGAVENGDLPAAGSVIYVTPNGAGKRDGSSWDNAIAGNTVYRWDAVAGPALATGDYIDPEETCDRVLDSEGNPVLTTDSKYCGGFGRSYFTSSKVGTSSTTVTNTWITEVNNYVDGPRDGESEVHRDIDPTESESTVDGATTDEPGFVAGWNYDSRYPYGEISGASRTFWRANPYTGKPGDYSTYTQFITAENTNGWINNTRAERYVGGLQYAVEKASHTNKSHHKDSVQVWVGAGKYTDYKGFIMRDSVSVYGGFPAGKFASPAMSERQALMSNVVNIPKSQPAQDFDAQEYETILQISDVNPKSSNTALNSDAVKFRDNDLERSQRTNTRSYEYKTRKITNTYTYLHEADNTDMYFQYPNFASGSTLREQDSPVDSTQYLYGKQLDDKDYWHILNPNTKTYYHVNREWREDALRIYDYDNPNTQLENAAAKKYRWIRLGNGSLTGLKMWQTLRNLEAGTHTLTFDLNGGYRNTNGTFDVTTNCGIYLHILNAEGTDLITPVLLKCRGNTLSDGTASNVRARAFRKTVTFTTSTIQNVTVWVEVSDGTKNTTSADATYGTADGRDPDYIPWYYKYDKGTEANPDQDWGTNNPNRREFFITNFKLKTQKDSYVLTNTTEPVINDTVVENPKATEVNTISTYEVKTARTTLRKRVLTMPDVCVPTYGGGGISDPVGMTVNFGDKLAHSDRVRGSSKDKRTASTETKREDPAYVEYNNVNWDGFTIRHGFIYDESMSHGGGAGVNMYEGAHLRNCIVINNFAGSRNMKGGGIFCDGATSTIEGCFVLDNTATHGTKKDAQKQIFAGGMFMYEGTCFNSLFANNYSNGSAGGVGFCVGRFYNNTIAYNKCDLVEGGHKNGGAISIATSSNPNLFVANTIIYGNDGMAIRERYDATITMNQINPFINCYVQNAVAFTQDLYKKNIGNHSDNSANFGVNNVLLDGVALSANNTPFAADFVNGVYTPGNASTMNDFRLLNHAKLDSSCVNHGTEELAGEFYQALIYKGNTDKQIKDMFIYKSVQQAVIPSNDVAFAKRVQDCQIDIGAYEYNAAYNIMPDTTTHPGKAIYYISYDSPGGDASSRTPRDAACRQKLQLALDAAGRYKYSLMTAAMYNKGEAGTYVKDKPNKHWTVEVWLEGDSTRSTITDKYEQWYTPTRSTKHSTPGYHDNTLDYSFIIPRGVQVKGGFAPGFYHIESLAGDTMIRADGTVKTDTTGKSYRYADERDPLMYRTVLSGEVTSGTGAEGKTFHVVTFTEDLFDLDEMIKEDGGQLSILTDEKDRAVIDGLFIENGESNSPDLEDRIGAGCVVTDYAHVRNCVIQHNTAQEYGGGLYLKPFALVSGCIIKYNTANVGGGVYIEAPVTLNNDSLAHIFSTTICENNATASAGGMFFDNTYARVNSTALWHNSANDNANVSGSFSRSSMDTEYPFTFCAVESRRLEGQGNIELSPTMTEGVRWDEQDPFNSILYYPIEMSSTLSRAGMTYQEYDRARAIYTTLDTFDIAGVSRKRWVSAGNGRTRGFAWKDTLVTKNNDMIEIGARAINKNYAINVDEQYVMYRLYVMHTDLIDSKAARALQNNTNTDAISNMYRQMGSCIYNPFHRLGDAFDYVIAARKANPAKYRGVRFEIFIEQGTYYPYHNAYGGQDQVRANSFLIPEAVLLVGGINSKKEDHKYGQEGYISMLSNVPLIGTADTDVPIPGTGYTINFEYTDSIRLRDDNHRPMRDVNLNSVIEPWELERQTILSGNAVAGEDFTHVYHVVTIHADSTCTGPQPIKYRHPNPDYDRSVIDPNTPLLIDPIPMDRPDLFHEECDLSILARTVGFDGLQFTGGYANHIDQEDAILHPYMAKTYFRGGGIFVDGNWTESFNEPDAQIPNVTDPADYNIPIVVENSIFTNNMAGNGGGIYSNGGIYVFGCHFTQNYSQGPMTKLDQRYIPWTAGGCIATNAVCDVANTLFDNNEARRGLYPIIIDNPEENIPDADARQGFGGVLSVAANSSMRVINCHFMRNKAVGYSAIYNFLANNHYSNPDSMQYAFNSIFWGNEVFEKESLADFDKGPDWNGDDDAALAASVEAFNRKYKASRAGVFHYDGSYWDRYEKLYHEYDSLYNYWVDQDGMPIKNVTHDGVGPFREAVITKLNQLRAAGDSLEGLFFCSYRKGYGPTPMKSTEDGYLLTYDEWDNYVDARKTPVKLKTSGPKAGTEDYTHLFTQVHGNNNVFINRVNNATDGPNFKQPSFVAGVDGYMQNADWLLARMNQTTDQGWGHLSQTVSRGVSYYITKYTGTEQFKTAAEALAAAKAIESSATEQDVYPVSGLPVATFDNSGVQTPLQGIYNFYATRYGSYMSASNPPLPLANQYYMSYTRTTNDTESSGFMDRISKNPKLGEKDVYIDLGIYEYQYVQLDIKGQEIDTMWVSTTTKDPIRHDGLTWETPTTDLQGAIDILLSSHNNHDKYICLMGDEEGSYSPTNVIDNRRAFIISTNTLSPLMPDSAEADHNYWVNSLTFLGGYSRDVKDAPRDPNAYPTIIEMPNTGNANQLNQLFVAEDMTRQIAQVNWQGEYVSRTEHVIPIVFDGLTFINPYSSKDSASAGTQEGLINRMGGAAIYYRWQRCYEGETGSLMPNHNRALQPDSAYIEGKKWALPKLTISNCTFLDNGARVPKIAERSPAVRIDHGGGSSLIVNSLFHSNAGAPVYAPRHEILETENNLAQVPNDVVIVNVTSALNDGHITLESDSSQVHNSIIWLDDLASDTTVQLAIHTDVWDKAENSTRAGTKQMTHNAVWGCFRGRNNTKETFDNDSLVTDNNDVFNGPGFVEPFVSATTSGQRRERSFLLNPSIMTHEKADSTLYRKLVFFSQYPDSTVGGERLYWRRSNGFKAAPIYTVLNDSDLAAKPRYIGNGMERGAYECRAVLQRVLYVQPNLPAFSAGDGSSWNTPFGQGQLQNAIDAAAVYTYFRQDQDPETRKAYVFVKGSNGAADYTAVMARDGVSVYGSLPGNFNDTAVITEVNGTKVFTNAECRRYVNYVRALTTGVASPNANPTYVNSVHMTGDGYTTGFMMDGFVISNPGTTRNTSPIILDNYKTVLRNCLVTDNKVAGGAPVVDVQRGLLYNCLFHQDSASSIVRVGTRGLVLNNTIVAADSLVAPFDSAQAQDGAVVNNIAVRYNSSTANCFAPYLTTKNPYTLPEFKTNKPILAYQLHERSAAINGGTESLSSLFDAYTTDSTIHFGHDRDILGNPRRLGGRVDLGALETWRIEPGQVVEITALTNKVYTQSEIEQASDDHKRKAFLSHYGGNSYPHPGSVVYLMNNSALTMQYNEPLDFQTFTGDPIIFRPAFMLLKPGASFYGNGHGVLMDYLAVEKRFNNQRFSLTAMPFNYTANTVTTALYTSAKDSLSHQFFESPNLAYYQYSGSGRSEKDYVFRSDNSTLWSRVDTVNRTANEGYLIDFGLETDTVLRFNAFAADNGQYVYTEEDMDKTVYLTQYDHRTAGTGTELNFTRQEDMGWNMKGLPWLVSNYRTDTVLEGETYLRQMYIPHVFYDLSGTYRSWDRGTTMSLGEAFLIQTATQKEREEVLFHLPYYGHNEPAARPIIRLLSPRPQGMVSKRSNAADEQHTSCDNQLVVFPDSTADKTVQYAYGRDGIKWTTAQNNPQLYMLDSKYATRMSLLGAAPTEVDIPLGVSVPKDTESSTYIFNMPEKAAFADYSYVWIIDKQSNRTVNLLEQDYETGIEPGVNHSRFALRIGGFPLTNKNGQRRYIVYAYSRTLFIRGLVAGDQIDIYAPTGQRIYSAKASAPECSIPLFYQSGYIVKVNDQPYKVLTM